MSELENNPNNGDLREKILKIVELAALPFTSSDCFRYVNARTKKEKDEVTSMLEELRSSGVISYLSHPGLKDRVVEKISPTTGESIEFKGTCYDINDVKILVGMGDLYNVSRVATISRMRGDPGGFQRAKETSWIHELATAFEKTFPPLLFTSVVLYFNKDFVTLSDGTLSIFLDQDSKPRGLIIDGQQRCYAAQEVRLREVLKGHSVENQPMLCPIVIIIGDKEKNSKDEIDFLRTLFINANNTRPLPRNLVDQIVGLLSDPSSMPLTRSRQNAYDPQQILRALDQDEGSPIFDMVAFDEKTTGDHPYNMTVAKRNVNYVMKKIPVKNADPIQAYAQILTDILTAIKKTWSSLENNVFPDLLRDPRAISPILVFLTDNLSAVEILAAPNRAERLEALLLPIKHYLHLVKKGISDWEEGGSWNPMQTARTSKGIIDAAGKLRDIYTSVMPSNPIN